MSQGNGQIKTLTPANPGKCDDFCSLVLIHDRKIKEQSVLLETIITDIGKLDKKASKLNVLYGDMAENTEKQGKDIEQIKLLLIELSAHLVGQPK